MRGPLWSFSDSHSFDFERISKQSELAKYPVRIKSQNSIGNDEDHFDIASRSEAKITRVNDTAKYPLGSAGSKI